MSQPHIIVPWDKRNEGQPWISRDPRRDADHAESHALVAVDKIAEVFTRGGDRDALAVPELVQPALNPLVVCSKVSLL